MIACIKKGIGLYYKKYNLLNVFFNDEAHNLFFLSFFIKLCQNNDKL